MNATVLFEGCGGSTAGLHAAGYATVGFEYWQPAVTCAQANGFDARLHDLSDPTLDHLVPYAPLWWASPPCQPFSAAGQGEGEFDDRDGFPWLLRLVALRLPEVVIVENVKGLTFRKHSAYLCAVLEGFRALGYEVDWKVLNCADLGVPQTRERCIIICRRDGGPITWPAPTHCETGGMFTDKWVTMAEALGWPETDALDYFTRGAGMIERHGERAPRPASRPAPTVHANFYKDMQRVSLADDGEGSACEIVGLTDVAVDLLAQQERNLGGEFVGAHGGVADGDGDGVHSHHLHQPANPVKPQIILHSGQNRDGVPITFDVTDRPAPTIGTMVQGQWKLQAGSPSNATVRPMDEPAPTVLANHDSAGWQFTNGDQAVRLSIPELATLQGFPPDWKWTGTKTQQARMVGNAVPPALAAAVASVNRPITLERAA